MDSKLNEKARQIREQDKRQLQNVAPNVETDPPKPLPPGSKLKVTGSPSKLIERSQIASSSGVNTNSSSLQTGQHATNPKPNSGSCGVYSRPISEKPKASSTDVVADSVETNMMAILTGGEKPVPTSPQNQMSNQFRFTSKFNAKPICPDESLMAKSLPQKQQGSDSIQKAATHSISDSVDPLGYVHNNTMPFSLSGLQSAVSVVGSNQQNLQTIPVLPTSVKSNNCATATTTENTSNYIPLSFPVSETQFTAQVNEHQWGSPGSLHVTVLEGTCKKNDRNFNSSDQVTPVKLNEHSTKDIGQPACAKHASPDPDFDMSFDNEEGLAELLSAVAKMNPKETFESKEVCLPVDSFPFFTNPNYPFSLESGEPQKQSFVGAIAESVAPTEAYPTLDAPQNANFRNPDNCPLVPTTWPVLSSANTRPAVVGVGPTEESPGTRHSDPYGCPGSLPASHHPLSLYEATSLNPHFGLPSHFRRYSSTENLHGGEGGSLGPPGTPQDALPQLRHSELSRKVPPGGQGGGGGGGFNRPPRILRPVFAGGEINAQGSMAAVGPIPGSFLPNSTYPNTSTQQPALPQQQRMRQMQPVLQCASSVKQQEMNPVQLIPAPSDQLMAVPLSDGRVGLVRVVHPMPTQCFTDSMELSGDVSRIPASAPSSGMNMMPFPMFVNVPVAHQMSSQTGPH
ncbi:unnamed protein product [Phytomonas sp. Hart1]|nr:unnamed protein product [Phytomonas sp. Hart1]|eukprot:CCW69896.1 unnamed protein product [Phytomonas sp. isolate Hart1]